MTCKLCLKDNKLIRNSHIIPDFMYKGLFDDNHRLHEVDITTGQSLTSKLKQTGAKEENILCNHCDNEILGKLERYASMVLYGGTPTTIITETDSNSITYTRCKELDYSKFKIFLLSLLWRASISSLPIFEKIKLGPHEDIIRKMILNNTPDVPAKYPCVMITYLNLKEMPYQIIGQPNLSREGGGYKYLFLIGGVLYIFYVSHHNIPSWVKEYSINLDGELRINHMSQKLAKATINNFVRMDLI